MVCLNNFRIISFLSFILLSSVTFLCDCVSAKEKDAILVAAASNLQFAMDEIIQHFEKKKLNNKVEIVYGSSGNFFNQIRNGAPFDLYFSANIRYPEYLEKKGLGTEASTYAFGRMAVMASVYYGIEVQKLRLSSLLHPTVKKIAIANPAHAPYGRSAIAFLKRQNIYEKIREKLIMGENISQAAQFVDSGAAEIGIIALSLAIKTNEAGRVSYWEIPAETYPPIEQKFIILKRTKKYPLVREFTDFVQGREGQSILIRHGFEVPAGSLQ